MAADRCRVAIGVPAYAGAAHVEAALADLLAQSHDELRLVVVDDRSPDATLELAAAAAAGDPRVTLVRNDRRLGLARNWQRALELALAACPGADYFAWGSDHDRWEPEWLETLVRCLDGDDEAVLAYPLDGRIDAAGQPVEREARRFETAGVRDPGERMRLTLRSRNAGAMVYGLMRVAALRRTAGMRPVLRPDRLLLAELALHGSFRQVERELWARRAAPGGLARQRRAIYPGRVPASAWIRPNAVHALALAHGLAVAGRGLPEIGRVDGLRYALLYHRVEGGLGVRKRLRKARNTARARVGATVRRRL